MVKLLLNKTGNWNFFLTLIASFFLITTGWGQTVTTDKDDYQPGDIVCWDLGKGVTHIGIVSSKRSTDGKRYLIVHNIGAGQVLEDCLFSFRIIGHFQYDSAPD